ncbi:GlxA family transcriptional regulator [Ruegeria profundi]|uniref:HTH araC/xylS-type domain-containing protein n=1 Tax=Ruegeria profundi TaxID=1685378 RepID=A0A0X3U1T8_9RHOB|nr:helix-turn-helix domain-containing protein [Ruegeria profundi]KUJ79560.1 hypothetical protein AVO44_10150 [Ruegeria profundi]
MQTVQVVILHPTPCQMSSLFITSEMLDTANRVARFHGSETRFHSTVLTPENCGPVSESPDLIILPGLGTATEPEVRATMGLGSFSTLVDALKNLAGPETVVAGACSGCFALGAAGLLDRRKVTTTWWLAPLLQSLFPLARLQSGELVVQDGNLVTAGASFSQIDLMLSLIEWFAGLAIAEDCRRFLLADNRPSQLPYISVATLVAGHPALQKAELYVRRNLMQQISLAELSEAAGLTPRTFSRRLSKATALTPSGFMQTIRVTEAIRLARSGKRTHEEIAERVGYADSTALRRIVRKRTGQTLESFRR